MHWVIFIVAIMVFAIGWLKWKVSTLALIYYMEKKQYKKPDDVELKECITFVVKNMLKG